MSPLRLFSLTLIIFLGLTIPASGVDSRAGMPPRTTVVDQAQIQKILENFIEVHRDYLPEGKIRFKKIDLPQAVKIPNGKLLVEVIPSDPSIIKSSRFTLIFRVDGRIVKNIVVRGELEVISRVVIAAADLQRGSLISAADVKLALADLTNLRNPIFTPGEVIGMRLKRSIRQGKPLSSRLVELPPIIKRGELVTITIRKGGLTVTARGIASHDAKQGAMVRVRNSSSQKEIYCRAMAPGRVIVEI